MFKLVELPYELSSLVPELSKEVLEFHYNKHHKGYVDTLNKLVKDTEFEKMELRDIYEKSSGPVRNNAGQIINHDFYWQSMSPDKQSADDLRITKALKRDFGSVDKFNEQFVELGSKVFGSGYVWLVYDKTSKKLQIKKTKNAENPTSATIVPLLCCDVWEHAYYLDYKNERVKYLENFCNVINWNFAEQNFKGLE